MFERRSSSSNGARLRVRPVEDRHLGAGPCAPRGRDPRDDLPRLVALLVEDGETDVLAALLRGLQRLAEAAAVLGDDRARGLQDRRRRAVVPLEADRLRRREVARELQDVRHVRAAPAVDGLVLVAHDEEVPGLARDEPHELRLDAVRVLVLVHEEVPDAPSGEGRARRPASRRAASRGRGGRRSRAPSTPAATFSYARAMSARREPRKSPKRRGKSSGWIPSFLACEMRDWICRGVADFSGSATSFIARFTTASWSSESKTTKPFGTPASSGKRRRSRTPHAWNVPTKERGRSVPRSAPTRSFISPAALFVNVTATTPSCGTPCATTHARRRVRTRVFPDPAPARTRSGPSPCDTAAACSGLRPSRRSSGRATKGGDGSADGSLPAEPGRGCGRIRGTMPFVLALDQGTTSSRALVFDRDGRRARHGAAGVPADLSRARPGRARPDGDLGDAVGRDARGAREGGHHGPRRRGHRHHEPARDDASSGSARRGARSRTRSSGRTAAPRRRATRSGRPATRRRSPRRPASSSTPTFPARS